MCVCDQAARAEIITAIPENGYRVRNQVLTAVAFAVVDKITVLSVFCLVQSSVIYSHYLVHSLGFRTGVQSLGTDEGYIEINWDSLRKKNISRNVALYEARTNVSKTYFGGSFLCSS